MLVHELILQGQKNDVAFFHPQKLTYGELQQQITLYRNYFYSCGIRTGENVGLFSRNSVEYVCIYMALAGLGAVVVPINFQLTEYETAYIVKDARIKRLITMAPLSLEIPLKQHACHQPVMQLIIPEIQRQMTARAYAPAPEPPPPIEPQQACTIIYTSGTTGKPKGAILSHENLVSNAQAFGRILPLDHQDNVLCVLPMYHCFAWTCAVLNPLLKGAGITVLETFSPKETVATIKEQQVTVMYAVPPIYSLLARLDQPDDLNGVRFFVSGGASLPEKIAKQFEEVYGTGIIEGYGLSEASPVVTFNLPEKRKYGSIGKALPGVSVKIIKETGETAATGQIGELIMKGPNVMKGYLNLPEQTAQTIRQGWLHTGDIAYQDEDGYFFIIDRVKDLIISNGENIYPREIEELLYTYPGIVEAAVIGVPDKLRGQAVRAYIVMKEGTLLDKKAVKEFLKNRLAAYKIPRDFLVVDALPKTPTGKLLKRALRQELAE